MSVPSAHFDNPLTFEDESSGLGTRSPPADLENAIEGLRDMTTQQVIGLFKSLDIDGNGVIDEEEMAIMMTRLGKPADEEAVHEMMMIMDVNNDGGVELEVSHPTLLRPIPPYYSVQAGWLLCTPT